MRLRMCEEHRALPACEKPPAWRVDVYYFAKVGQIRGSGLYVLFSDLTDFEFDLPDIEKQEELAELLWSMEYTRRAYRKLIQETDELVKPEFVEVTENTV